ncbi:DUF3016 domain-containing protein [Massilia arenosa]|uniref:DUF3016 domain-containing protein n=1 Tax=Zemynaea arenosa TaxID=2561931 RepID=A0A4Y9SGN7_9BURK|nr:DUF3016 domain-containing protein [Massilia arenosa]TFW20778.1 DUF3016 domain-containing protein [Massilia arenosa]
MRRLLSTAVAILLAFTSAGASAGTASIQFSNVDTYTDFPSWEKDRDDFLQQIGAQFIKRAGDRLAANEELKIEILQFDLAGIMVKRNAIERRLINSNDWPSFQLRLLLLRDGVVVDKGLDSMQGMDKVSGHIRYVNDDPLRLEKTMIDRWFTDRFPKRQGS